MLQEWEKDWRQLTTVAFSEVMQHNNGIDFATCRKRVNAAKMILKKNQSVQERKQADARFNASIEDDLGHF